ncbi:MAG TPA: DinB family protein [Fimbriiglobus sp.]|nr:DinB family protein [Fimbriiglobus sp.]
MPRIAPDYPLRLLMKLLDEGFDVKAWHGPNLRGSLRRVDAQTAAWRPGPGRKCVWEHAVHAAYWKYTVRRRLLGEDRGSFPLKGSNWFVRPDPAVHRDDWEKAWKADLKLLDQTHATLRDAVADLSPDELPVVPPGSKTTTGDLVYSIAMHDVYHAGQVQLIKRLKANGRRQPAGG